jgi:hypothetical protein
MMHIIMQTSPPGTPLNKSSPAKLQISPINCRGILFHGKGGIAKELIPIPMIPSPPRKIRKNIPKGILGIPFLSTTLVKILTVIGKGSFGIVSEACFSPPSGSLPGTPDSPSVAVKIVCFDNCASKKDLAEEAERLGSPGCVPGYAFVNMTDNTYMAFMPKGISFDKINFMKMTKDILEHVITMTKEAIMIASFPTIPDIKPANMMILSAGTSTVVKDRDGQPYIGPETTKDTVVVCDLGSCDPIDGGDPLYSVLPDEKNMKEPDFDLKLRNFKALMMEALIRNSYEPSGKTIQEIVAPLCPWNYAGGVQYQDQKLFN